MLLIVCPACVCVKMPLWSSQKYWGRPNLALIPSLFPWRQCRSAHTRVHTHADLETHFDLHHLVWSARPRAWQLMINISLRPLPSWKCVHANTHPSTKRHICCSRPCTGRTLPLGDTYSHPAPAVCYRGRLALWTSASDSAPSQQGHLFSPHPIIFDSQSLSLATCSSLLKWSPAVSLAGKVGSVPRKKINLCAFGTFNWFFK